MVNTRGKKSIPDGGQSEATYLLKIFDGLPPATREALANFPIQVQTLSDHNHPGMANYLTHILPDTIRHSALAEYGPDHPQAQGEFCWPLKR